MWGGLGWQVNCVTLPMLITCLLVMQNSRLVQMTWNCDMTAWQQLRDWTTWPKYAKVALPPNKIVMWRCCVTWPLCYSNTVYGTWLNYGLAPVMSASNLYSSDLSKTTWHSERISNVVASARDVKHYEMTSWRDSQSTWSRNQAVFRLFRALLCFCVRCVVFAVCAYNKRCFGD